MSSIDGFLLGFLLGALANNPTLNAWQPFIEQYNRRVINIQSAKIIIPYGYLGLRYVEYSLYCEGILAYMCGLPNASIPLMARVLELALRSKYEEIEKKSGDKLGLARLIDWLDEKYEEDKKKEDKHAIDIATGIRLLRNTIHNEKILEEQDSLETIRHVSRIINILYPWGHFAFEDVRCFYCKNINSLQINKEQYFIYNLLQFQCQSCKLFNNFYVL